MMGILYFVVLIGSLAVLSYSSEQVVKSVVKLSKFFRIRKIALGLILIAVTTSLPELSVSVTSSIVEEGAIAAGNVFGSNIANILLILGICALISDLKMMHKNIMEIGFLLLITTIISAYILFNSTVQITTLGLLEGIILLLIFVIYILHVIRENNVDRNDSSITKYEALHAFIVFVIGIIFVIMSSGIVVNSAVKIVELFGLAESFIGATIIAVGTSIPELSIAIQSARKKHYDLVLGNIVGSNMTNITLILGTAAAIAPISVNLSVFITALIFAIIANVLLLYYVAVNKRMQKKEGVLFLLVYLLFLITIFILQTQKI